MTTQEKTAAIQKIIANHKDNVAAIKAAGVPEGDDWVIAAAGDAARADLVKVFALPASSAAPRALARRQHG